MQIPYGVSGKVDRHTVTNTYTVKESSDRHEIRRSRLEDDYFKVSLGISELVTDDMQSKVHGRTAEDVKQSAGLVDVDLQRKLMTVMSNSMSDEDFTKMCENGFDPSDADAETLVTVMDRIKATLAESGVTIAGYNDHLDVEVLKEITGSEIEAQALSDAFSKANLPLKEETMDKSLQAMKLADDTSFVGEEVYRYMLLNQMPPTIENYYLASHSAGDKIGQRGCKYYNNDGYLSERAQEVHWESIQGQIEETIVNAGLEVNEEIIDSAKWMIEEGIPVTEESLQLLSDLKEVEFPLSTDAVAKSIASAVSYGEEPIRANLGRTVTLQERAVQILDQIKENEGMDAIHAKRYLEEIRLSMTVEGNIHLLRRGFAIETAPLDQLVTQLKMEEERQNGILFEADRTKNTETCEKVFQQTLIQKEAFYSMPASLIGELQGEEKWSLQKAYDIGLSHQSRYQRAGEAYEQLMTAPDASLGDSIRKAFRNTEALLQEIEVEPNKENCRAVRILGYNGMEITKEAVNDVAALDARFTKLVSSMTPSNVLHLIRSGKNPLECDMAVLEEALQNETYESNQDYAKFLYHLEQRGDITEGEKQTYIGIYRLLKQIEKKDGAALGGILKTGAEFSFSNLLSMVRSRKSVGMDILVDESVGGVESIVSNGTTITQQIYTAFQEMEEQAQNDNTLTKELLTQAEKVSEEAIRELNRADVTQTVSNLYAAETMLADKGFSFSKVFAKNKTKDARFDEADSETGDTASVEDLITNVISSFEGKKEAQVAYQEMIEGAQRVLEDSMKSDNNTYLDLKAMNLTYKQLSISQKYALAEHYEIPVYVNDTISMIHLKIESGEGSSQEIRLQMKTEVMGNVFARIRVEEGEFVGDFYYDVKSGKKAADLVGEEAGYPMNVVYISDIERLQTESTRARKPGNLMLQETELKNVRVSANRLYTTAKQLIQSLIKDSGSKSFHRNGGEI